MAIISFDKDTVIDYVPEYGGNRESDNPCIVKMKFMPYAKVQHYARTIAAMLKNERDPAKASEVAQVVQRKQFMDSVEGVSGFLVDGKEITAPGELYDAAPTELIHELIKAMEDAARLSAGQRKN